MVWISDRFKTVENCKVKAFGDIHVGSRTVLPFLLFCIVYNYIFVKCIIKSVFYKQKPDSKNY